MDRFCRSAFMNVGSWASRAEFLRMGIGGELGE